MIEYKLIPISEKYFDFVRELRTCDENINGFIEQVQITSEQQNDYMLKHGHNYYICLYNNEPVGFVGVIDNDIRVATEPKFKKLGVGKFMINEIIKIYPNAKAKIKVDNLASLNLFKTCGFQIEFLILKK